jgi:serine/threonine protein kinase
MDDIGDDKFVRGTLMDSREGNRPIKSNKSCFGDANALLLENGLQASELLGSGTFSNVYLCTTLTTGLNFAVKVIPKATTVFEDDNTSRLQRAIENEQGILWGLRNRQHPNLLFLHYHFENDHYLGLVFDHSDKGDLDSVIKNVGSPGLTETLSLDIFRQIACGVNYLHSCGIIHRDLKTKNILLKSAGNTFCALVGDFGFARELRDDKATTQCGTPLFMAPEVINLTSKGYNYAADIWGLGCILYCCLYGRRPFNGDNPRDLLKDIYGVRGTSSSMSLPQKPRVSPQCRAILSRALDICQHTRLSISHVETRGLVGIVSRERFGGTGSSTSSVTKTGAHLRLTGMAKDTWRVLRSYLRGTTQEAPPRPPLVRTTEPFVMVEGSPTVTPPRRPAGFKPGAGKSPAEVFHEVLQIVILADAAVHRLFSRGAGTHEHLIPKAASLYMYCCEVLLKPLLLKHRGESHGIASNTYRTARSFLAKALERVIACCEWAQGRNLFIDVEAEEVSTGFAEVIDMAQRVDMESDTSHTNTTRMEKRNDTARSMP